MQIRIEMEFVISKLKNIGSEGEEKSVFGEKTMGTLLPKGFLISFDK